MRMRRARRPAAAEAGTATASGPRDALPRLRLLVGRQHGDRVTAVCLRLFAKPLHLRPHLIELLPHARARGGIRTLAARALRTKRVHLSAQRSPPLGRSPRNGRESRDLRVGELELAGPGQEKLRRVVDGAAAARPAAHGSRARHWRPATRTLGANRKRRQR